MPQVAASSSFGRNGAGGGELFWRDGAGGGEPLWERCRRWCRTLLGEMPQVVASACGRDGAGGGELFLEGRRRWCRTLVGEMAQAGACFFWRKYRG